MGTDRSKNNGNARTAASSAVRCGAGARCGKVLTLLVVCVCVCVCFFSRCHIIRTILHFLTSKGALPYDTSCIELWGAVTEARAGYLQFHKKKKKTGHNRKQENK